MEKRILQCLDWDNKIVAMIGKKNEYNKPEILGVGKSKSLV
jgi:hypothetical protein